MIDIIEQKEYNIQTQKDDVVCTNNTANNLVKELQDALGYDFENIEIKPFTSILTLGKLPFKTLHIVDLEGLNCKKETDKIINKIASLKGTTTVLIDTFECDNYTKFVERLSEEIFTKNYTFDQFKSKKEEKNQVFNYFGETKIYNHVLKGYVYGQSINKARDLVNTPYNYLNAVDLANYAKGLEKYDGITVQIYDKKQIEEMKMGAFLGVNKGSSDEPRLITIKYQGTNKFENPTALVGKGVMYDTGGYSLKTPQSMPGMKVDMAGAAAVISAIEAIARLKANENVMAIVAATDNRIGDGAIVPDDILTAADGQTIEIVSTDAEGRLTLADAVWFAQKEGAKRVIDTATLTGAMVAALGDKLTGAFTNNKGFYQDVKEASERVDEPIWEMPITDTYREELKSKVADMSNKGGRLAGASIAAAFIEKFINKETEWVHLDIAGTSTSKEGATGVMVKTFAELFL